MPTSRLAPQKYRRGRVKCGRSRTRKATQASLEVRRHRLLIEERRESRRRSSRLSALAPSPKAGQLVPARIATGDEGGLVVQQYPGKGRGVAASRPFEVGEAIVRYPGPLVTAAEGQRREQEYPEELGSYVFYFSCNGQDWCVDGTSEELAGLGRLVNHSRKRPNAKMVCAVDEAGQPVLYLKASKRIGIGCEILYDYGPRDAATLRTFPWMRE